MLQIRKYLLEKIAATAHTMTTGNLGVPANKPQPKIDPPQEEYQQASLSNLDGNNENVQVQMPTPAKPARNLTNTQMDYMQNARDRIDEIQRYHSGAIQYDPKKYTSNQWSEYVNSIIKDPMYSKITAQGVTEDQLKQYQIEMANNYLNNHRKRFEQVDPTHPMVQDSQAITGDYAFDNYQWENQSDYRKKRGLETTFIKGTTIPVMKNQLSAKRGGYTAEQRAQIKANRAAIAQSLINRHQRQDAPEPGTLRAVHEDGTQVTRTFDNQGNFRDTITKVNLPKRKNLTPVQWEAFRTGTTDAQAAQSLKQAEQTQRNENLKNIRESYNYFLNKGYIPSQMINKLKPGTAGYEGAMFFRQQQYNHMNQKNPTLQKFNPYSNNYMNKHNLAQRLNYDYATADLEDNKRKVNALLRPIYGNQKGLQQR